MLRSFIALFFVFVSSVFLSVPLRAAEPGANPEREFILSCTYGVLAGTLVGAASLAFVDKPGDNLQRIARGASIGLYVGIGLGYYTVYILPKQLQKEEEKILDGEAASRWMPKPQSAWAVYPVVSEQGVDGVGAMIQISRF